MDNNAKRTRDALIEQKPGIRRGDRVGVAGCPHSWDKSSQSKCIWCGKSFLAFQHERAQGR